MRSVSYFETRTLYMKVSSYAMTILKIATLTGSCIFPSILCCRLCALKLALVTYIPFPQHSRTVTHILSVTLRIVGRSWTEMVNRTFSHCSRALDKFLGRGAIIRLRSDCMSDAYCISSVD